MHMYEDFICSCRKRTLASTSTGEDGQSDGSKRAKLTTSVSKKPSLWSKILSSRIRTINRRPRLTALHWSGSCGTLKNAWHCSKRVGDVEPGVMVYLTCAGHWSGVGKVRSYMDWSGCKVRLHMLTSDLTSLVPPQFSLWLQGRKLAPTIYLSNSTMSLERLHVCVE